MSIIVFDTETTGLPNVDAAPLQSQPHIIEFAAIKLEDDLETEIERLEFICNPGIELSDIITKITGLKTSDVSDKLPFSAYYERLCTFFCGAKTFIAHNLQFDRNLLKFELQRLDKLLAFPWPYEHICTIEKTLHVEGYRLNLSKLHKHCTGAEHVNGAHRAMADVEALLRCCKKLRADNII